MLQSELAIPSWEPIIIFCYDFNSGNQWEKLSSQDLTSSFHVGTINNKLSVNVV